MHTILQVVAPIILAIGMSATATSVVVADDQAAQQRLLELFPYTGPAGHGVERLSRVAASLVTSGANRAGSVIVDLAYPALGGAEEHGQARIFLPPALLEGKGGQYPLVHNAGYELDEGNGVAMAARGCIVCTPHAHPLNPLSRGVNLDRAIMHAVNALPFVDRRRVSIQGGSAGGWMTLMLSAEQFPLVWSMPDVPPVHWGYNGDYIASHKELAVGPPGSTKPPVPVLLAVSAITDQSNATYGVPYTDANFLAASPLASLTTITAPVLVTFSTADMLVPIDQVGADLVQKTDKSLFPLGFSSAMTDKIAAVRGKRTLTSALGRDQYELFHVPAGPNPTLLFLDVPPTGPAQKADLPFTKDHQWSIVVLDEGGKEPKVGHNKYLWSLNHEPFRLWAEAKGVQAAQLTLAKLERLMMRYLGQPWLPMEIQPEGATARRQAVQLDYPEAEKADVVGGLAAFAADDDCAVLLGELYGKLPRKLKALGGRLGTGSAASVREALAHAPH